MNISAACCPALRIWSTASVKRCMTWLRLGKPVSESCSARNCARASVRLMALTSTSLTSSASWPVTASRQRRAETSCQRSPCAVRTARACVATPTSVMKVSRLSSAGVSMMRSASRSSSARTEARAAGLRYSGRPSSPYSVIITAVCSSASTERSDSGSSTVAARASHSMAMRPSSSRWPLNLTLSDTGRPAGYSVHCSLKDAPWWVKSFWYCTRRRATDSDMSTPMSRAHSSSSESAFQTRSAA